MKTRFYVLTVTIDPVHLVGLPDPLVTAVSLFEIALPRLIHNLSNGAYDLAPCMVRRSSGSGGVSIVVGPRPFARISFASHRKLLNADLVSIDLLWGHGRVNLQHVKQPKP